MGFERRALCVFIMVEVPGVWVSGGSCRASTMSMAPSPLHRPKPTAKPKPTLLQLWKLPMFPGLYFSWQPLPHPQLQGTPVPLPSWGRESLPCSPVPAVPLPVPTACFQCGVWLSIHAMHRVAKLMEEVISCTRPTSYLQTNYCTYLQACRHAPLCK